MASKAEKPLLLDKEKLNIGQQQNNVSKLFSKNTKKKSVHTCIILNIFSNSRCWSQAQCGGERGQCSGCPCQLDPGHRAQGGQGELQGE